MVDLGPIAAGLSRVPQSSQGENLKSKIKEVAQDALAFSGQHRLGMELHPMNRVTFVPQAHYFSLPCESRNGELGGRGLLDDQRMVASCLEWAWQAREEGIPPM